MSTENTVEVAAPAVPPKSFWKSLGRKLLLLAMSCLFGLVLAELVVLMAAGEQPKFPRHVVEAPWKLRYNEPGISYRHKSADVNVRFRINSQGMRADRDFSYEKPAGTTRILSLGDSFTIGYEVDIEQCFSSIIEQRLNSEGHQVEVLNAGVSGFSSAEQLAYFERELIKYAPDVVMVSFCSNDLEDNLRTNLFRVDEANALFPEAEGYVPAGRLGNFLNSSWFFNLLSERSNAFVLTKEKLTHLVKRRIVEKNVENLDRVVEREAKNEVEPSGPTYAERLCGAIFERLYTLTLDKGIPLVFHSIPTQSGDRSFLIDAFPTATFDLKRPGVFFVSGKSLLDPHLGKTPIYNERSHFHWTPFAHEETGDALARLILDNGLLPRP